MKIGKINSISIVDTEFTSVLKHLHTPPVSLYVAGTLSDKRIKSVAIVGSRKPTAYGIEVTRQFAHDLAKQGIVIISGLAFGIDAVAHKAALEAGGTTIAVMANGLHRIYPASHTGLAEEIVRKGGAIISEKKLGYDARKHDFLARNRIVSGLADAVLVTEATDRSGTFSTVGHALEQNKEVFAVPGPVTSLLSAGPNRLIQQGAHVALSARDILSVLAPETLEPAGAQSRLPLGDTPLEASIISLIKRGVSDSEDIQQQTDADARKFLQTLTMMELKGTLRSLGANKWALGDGF